MTKVMCFGTFDLLHPGHVNYLEQAKKHGNHLIVIVARDRTKQLQHKKMLFNEKERLHLIQSLKIVNQAHLGDLTNFLKPIQKLKPDVICLGHDHNVKITDLKQQLFPLKPQIKRLKPYKRHKYRSSLLKSR